MANLRELVDAPVPKNSIITAINLNDLPLVRKCVEEGANVNGSWPIGHHSVFSKAVEKGNIKIIEYLIQNGANLNKGMLEIKSTPLIVAIRNNCSLDIVELLVRNGADVNENDCCGRLPLNEALTLNTTSVVKYLIEQGADINQTDGSGATPISLAVIANNLAAVELLVSKDANVHKADVQGNTAMTLAQKLNDRTIHQYLQNRTIFENSSVYHLKTPVTLKRSKWSDIQYYDSLKEVETLLAEEATDITEYVDPTLTSSNNFWNASTDEEKYKLALLHTNTTDSLQRNFGNTVVMTSRSNNNCLQEEINSTRSRNNAKYMEVQEPTQCQKIQSLEDIIFNGSLEDLKLIISEKTTTSKLDTEGFSPLANAIMSGRTEMVNYLLTMGANSCKKVNGKTPLILSVEKGNLEVIELLLQHGAKHTIQTAFFEAVVLGKLEIVKFFIAKEVLLDLVYKDGSTPLIKSIQTKNFDIIKTLVENGANVNTSDRYGNLPIVVSLEIGDVDAVTYLAQNNAVLPCQLIQKCPYLQKYIEANNLKMVEVLIELLKVKLNVMFDCGYSPLTKATELENIKIVKCILKNYIDGINEPDNNNKTPLSIAATNQDLPIIKYLIESGADINLAKEEIEECATCSEDFALYLEYRKK